MSQLGIVPATSIRMLFFLVAYAFSLLLDLIGLGRQTDYDKDVEILLLRQQLRILQRKDPHPPRIPRWQKLTLVILARKLTNLTNRGRTQLSYVVLLFKPDTLLKWHRDLVRRKWTYRKRTPRGRPPISPELVALILGLAKENPAWAMASWKGRWASLATSSGVRPFAMCSSASVFHQPPTRGRQGSSWRTFLTHYKDQMVACDFFTVETAWLKTIYILFFIELGSRRVHLAGCTATPTSAWVTQQARHFNWKLQAAALPTRFLIHDHDTTVPAAFDTIFTSEDITIIRTPVRAPNANAYAER